mgnify:FL=1
MPLVSIIIPVYNRQQSILFCLESISRMNSQDFEVIIIDDGSTDNTSTICKNFCTVHNQFRYIYQCNRGVSNARNHGIDEANGTWITFVDSDDAVCKEHLDNIVLESSTDTDLVISNFQMIGTVDNISVIPITCKDATQKRIESTEPIKYMFSDYNPYENPIFSTCGKFFRRSICIQHNIRFNESLSLDEDQLFVSTYLKYVNHLVHYPNANTYLFLDWGGIHLSGKVHSMDTLLHVYHTNYNAFKELYEKGGRPCIYYSNNYIIEKLISYILLRYCSPRFYKNLRSNELKTFIKTKIHPEIKGIEIKDLYIRNSNVQIIYQLLVKRYFTLAIIYCRIIALYKSLSQKIYNLLTPKNISLN